jgi:light-regulated signal transduction histidine kinase (bacteriophytochrome)
MNAVPKINISEQSVCDAINLAAFTQLQTYGTLLVIDRKSLRIIQFSENANVHLKTEVLVLQQHVITHFLTSTDKSMRVNDWLERADKRYHRFIWQGEHVLLPVWIYIHQRPDVILLEIEVVEEQYLEEHIFSMMDEVVNLNIDGVYERSEELALHICNDLALITGYDRIILYRFESDNSGLVIAEAITEGMESFLGLRFPATDIPENVRSMYLHQPLRYIPDINDVPISLIPDIKPGTLDLSNVILRAVSPVHIEYLHNMGVSSSLSVAIIHNGRLWGLIACQHKKPKKLSMYYRFGLLLLTRVVVKQLTLIDEKRDTQLKNIIFQDIQRIQGVIYNDNKLSHVFEKINKALLALFSADGVVYIYQDYISLIGLTPDIQQINALLDWLMKSHHFKFFATNTLPQEYRPSMKFTIPSYGLLALPITPGDKHYILLFRNELISQVLWAGDPGHVMFKRGEAYSPRQSFKAWKETVTHQADEWKSYEVSAAMTLHQTLLYKQLQLVLHEQKIDGILHQEEIKKNKALLEKETQLELVVEQRTNQLTEKNTFLLETLERLNLLQKGIIQTEKMATIGQLAAGVAHEINNPLSYVLNNTYILKKYCKLFKKAFDFYSQLMNEFTQNSTYTPSPLYHDIVLFNQTNKLYSKLCALDDIFSESIEGSLRIKQIVSSLSSFSKGSQEEEYTDVNELIKSAIDIAWNELKYKCTVVKNLATLPKILISSKQLELIIVNLLLNAAQSIVAEGEITITSFLSGTTIQISISDTGCGISEENVSKLFTPFFTTKPIGQSTGLSLATAYDFVKNYGGMITVTTKLGHGSTFTVHLPIKTTG